MDAPAGACVVLPTYDERENVRLLLGQLEGLGLRGLKVLVVDDSSPDGTADVVGEFAKSRPWVKLMTRVGKKGIGSAYQDGFRAAIREMNPLVIVEMDADLQHPPSALPALLDAIAAGADVAVGSRYVPGGGTTGWSWTRRMLSRGANAFARAALGLEVRDATSGFRAYTRDAATRVAEAELPAKGFEFQVASLHLLKGTSKVVEVPFVFARRGAGVSKLGLGEKVRFLFAVVRLALS